MNYCKKHDVYYTPAGCVQCLKVKYSVKDTTSLCIACLQPLQVTEASVNLHWCGTPSCTRYGLVTIIVEKSEEEDAESKR